MANVTRINLTAEYAIAVEVAAAQQGCSQAEIVRRALRHYWGEKLENAPTRSTVQPVTYPPTGGVTRPTVQPVIPRAEDLFSCSA